MGGRAVECTGLENRRGASPPEFESQPIRHFILSLQVQKIIHTATMADTPSPAQAKTGSAATEPPVSAAPAANKNCHAAEAITETAAEEMPQALRDFFTDTMLLPDNYDYGMLEVSASPKAEKIVYFSEKIVLRSVSV